MKSLTKGSFRTAIKTIRSNRARSFTTLLGIIVAVVSAIVVVGIGTGASRQVEGQLSKLGKDLVVVRPGNNHQISLWSSLGQSGATAGLTSRDVAAARSAQHVRSVTPLATLDGSITVKNTVFDGTVVGTTPDFASVVHQGVAYGGFLDGGGTNTAQAVIGADVAARLFGENVPLGRGFSFRGQVFIVVGILKEFDTVPLASEVDFNNAIFIPYGVAQRLTDNTASVYQMLVRPDSTANIDAMVASLNSKLRAVHGGAQAVSVLKQGQSLGVTNSILNLLSRLVIAAAATSLLVGGIGIMNIMLVSVTERMGEIGIRKAVGATNRQILNHFLVEAAVLSVIGWCLGFVLSAAIIYWMRLFTTLQPVIPWPMVGISCLVTIVVGTVFGSIPALKAARKDPINALRNE